MLSGVLSCSSIAADAEADAAADEVALRTAAFCRGLAALLAVGLSSAPAVVVLAVVVLAVAVPCNASQRILMKRKLL